MRAISEKNIYTRERVGGGEGQRSEANETGVRGLTAGEAARRVNSVARP